MRFLVFAVAMFVASSAWATTTSGTCTGEENPTWDVDNFCACAGDDDGTANNLDAVGGADPACNPATETCYSNSACFNKYGGDGTPIVDGIMFCEDGDIPALYGDVTTTDTDAPGGSYGPMYDDQAGNSCGGTNNRGLGSYVSERYGKAESNGRIFNPDPSSPTAGCNCDLGTPGATSCFGHWSWTETDQWGPTATKGLSANLSVTDFVCNGDDPNCPTWDDSFDAETTTTGLGIPDHHGTDDNCGVWDGLGVWGERWIDGEACENDTGAFCSGGFSANSVAPGTISADFENVTDFWTVQVIAVADNWKESGLQGTCDDDPDQGCLHTNECGGGIPTCTDWPLKDWEIKGTGTQGPVDVWFGGTAFYSNIHEDEDIGIGGRLLHLGAGTESQCNTNCGAATVTLGQCACDSLGMTIGPDFGADAAYSFQANAAASIDWPIGDWACLQTKVTGLGTSSLTYESWVNEVKVIDISNLDSTNQDTSDIDGIVPNWYDNVNQDVGGEPYTNEVTKRYRDNHMWVDSTGSPLTCAQLGFDVGPPPFSATLDAAPNPTIVGTSVQFDAIATGSVGPNFQYSLDCVQGSGIDAGPTNAQSTTFSFPLDVCDASYASANTYTAELTISDCGASPCGTPLETVTDTLVITVDAPLDGPDPGGGAGGGWADGAPVLKEVGAPEVMQ